MSDMRKYASQDPKVILQTAIEALNVFTQPGASCLEVGEDGRLIAAKQSRLERVMGLARCYIAPLFSDLVRKTQEKRLRELKKAILQARDIIQSHSPLIEKFKEGDEAQRKLAESALSTIGRYNAVVAQESASSTMKSDVYNYERQRLLLDEEIKGQPIELPYAFTIKYDSHPGAHSAQKMLKELSQTWRTDLPKTAGPPICSTYKKDMQFMLDTFRMKTILIIQTHLHTPVAEIVPLVQQATVEIDENSTEDQIHMHQLIKVDAWSIAVVTGHFKRSSSSLMTMPLLEKNNVELSFQLTHSGYPYPSQYTGWSLGDKWVDASPLRTDQTPLFHQVNQRKKRLAYQLLFDQAFIQKMRKRDKIKQQVFDQNRDLFLPLHRQLQRQLQEALQGEHSSMQEYSTFDEQLAHASSPFHFLSERQEHVLDLFITRPMKALEEEWLGAASTPLRLGLPQERFQAASLRLEEHRQQSIQGLDPIHPDHSYFFHQGLLLGKPFQAIGLQYQSEKMGFSPPFLNDFERRLQACAFQQLLAFLDECEHRLEGGLDPVQIKSDLLTALSKDIELLDMTAKEEDDSLPIAIVNELEVYFNSRFYSRSREV